MKPTLEAATAFVPEIVTQKNAPGTFVKPCPFRRKGPALTVPENAAFALSSATFVDSRASGSVPTRFVVKDSSGRGRCRRRRRRKHSPIGDRDRAGEFICGR